MALPHRYWGGLIGAGRMMVVVGYIAVSDVAYLECCHEEPCDDLVARRFISLVRSWLPRHRQQRHPLK